MTQPEFAHPSHSTEGEALLAAIDTLPPFAPTACVGWTAHDIVAHLAAGAKETADLVEESLAGRPDRPTRGFDERERPFRAMPDDELRWRLIVERCRKVVALDALARRTRDPAIAFTGTRVTAAEFETHGRSEAAIHRWDLVGDDDIGRRMLSQPDLTTHAIRILDEMSVLDESARALGGRAAEAGSPPVRIVFRSPNQPDVVLTACHQRSQFELAERPTPGDTIVTTDPAGRLLILWGRKPSDHRITIDGDPAVIDLLGPVVWLHAQSWPLTRPSAGG